MNIRSNTAAGRHKMQAAELSIRYCRQSAMLIIPSNSRELVMAVTTIAADLVATTGLDGPSVYQNLDRRRIRTAAALSDRGAGLRDPQLTDSAP